MNARTLEIFIDNIQQNSGEFLNRKSKIKHRFSENLTAVDFLNPFIESLLGLENPNPIKERKIIPTENTNSESKILGNEQQEAKGKRLNINSENVVQFSQPTISHLKFSKIIEPRHTDKSLEPNSKDEILQNRLNSITILAYSSKAFSPEEEGAVHLKNEDRKNLLFSQTPSISEVSNFSPKSNRIFDESKTFETYHQYLPKDRVSDEDFAGNLEAKGIYDKEILDSSKETTGNGRKADGFIKPKEKVVDVVVKRLLKTSVSVGEIETNKKNPNECASSIPDKISGGQGLKNERKFEQVEREQVSQQNNKAINSNKLVLNELAKESSASKQELGYKNTKKVFPVLNNNFSSYGNHKLSLSEVAKQISQSSDNVFLRMFNSFNSKTETNSSFSDMLNTFVLNSPRDIDFSKPVVKIEKGKEINQNIPSVFQSIIDNETSESLEKSERPNQKLNLIDQNYLKNEQLNQDVDKNQINNFSDNQHKFEQRDKTEQKPVEKSTNYISNFDKTTEPEPSKVSTLNQLNSQVKFESELTKETLKPSANIHIARISELPQKISSFVESVNQFPARAEITLSPKSLGMVIVDITVVNNEVKVMFKTETKEAQQILESQIGTLKDKLASLGFDKQNFEFVNQSEGNLLSGFANYRNEGRNEEENLRRQFLRSFANLRTKNENYFENIWRENDFQHQSSERQW